jgi:hypothetical protein
LSISFSTADYADKADWGAVAAAIWFSRRRQNELLSGLHELSALEGVHIGRIQIELFFLRRLAANLLCPIRHTILARVSTKDDSFRCNALIEQREIPRPT